MTSRYRLGFRGTARWECACVARLPISGLAGTLPRHEPTRLRCLDGISPRIARRSRELHRRLGWHRLVVERTLAWLNRSRRLTLRYERREDIHLAFLALGRTSNCHS